MWLALIDASHDQIKVLTAVAHVPQLLWFKEKNGRMAKQEEEKNTVGERKRLTCFCLLQISEEI